MGLGQFDGWGQPFVYRVTGDFADATDGTGCGTATAGVSFELCSTGDILVDDQSSAGTIVASLLPAIIVSRGKNWVNSGSVDERENTDADRVFVLRNYSKVAGSEFDDLVAWITPSVLQNRMVSAGRLP